MRVAELLIKNGADVNIKNNDGKTPLEIAFKKDGYRTDGAIYSLLAEAGKRQVNNEKPARC